VAGEAVDIGVDPPGGAVGATPPPAGATGSTQAHSITALAVAPSAIAEISADPDPEGGATNDVEPCPFLICRVFAPNDPMEVCTVATASPAGALVSLKPIVVNPPQPKVADGTVRARGCVGGGRIGICVGGGGVGVGVRGGAITLQFTVTVVEPETP
jgi:hypothetical protein